MKTKTINQQTSCYHCGEDCGRQPIHANDKSFCCDGCRMVYNILNNSGLCDYYNINKTPGVNQKVKVRESKFSFLDDNKIAQSLVSYKDARQTHVTFYLPHIHCSSCLWLLENLHKLNEHIISSKVNFTKKEADVIFNHDKVSLRHIAELLTAIGYEPYISFNDMNKNKPQVNRSKIYKLGVAGFCFANIMLLSFPEYLGINAREQSLAALFRTLNVLLSLPVVFYCASEFYLSAYKSLKHGFLNIDAPIVLAVFVTFIRSLFEVFTNTGAGYLDSMSGIVFFMLIGRVLQSKTFDQLSFERDYTSYFPIAITRLIGDRQETAALPDINLNDTLLIHSEEIIPADGILTRGKAMIDYSFVTGESAPVLKEMGEIVYAGGKQTGGNIEILVIKPVAQSYLTRLWNSDEKAENNPANERSFVHWMSRWFTWMVLSIAIACAAYWYVVNPDKIWLSATAVLIVACPCALLLSNTFTNSNILRLLSRNKLYLRNAQTIEDTANITHIVFDKTGTLTTGSYKQIEYKGARLRTTAKRKITSLAAQSTHPVNKAIVAYLGIKASYQIAGFKETPGKGIEGFADGNMVSIGSADFLFESENTDEQTAVYVAIEKKTLGKFTFKNHYRSQVPRLISTLKKLYPLTVLSGDNAGEKLYLQNLFGSGSQLLFHQQPQDKLQVIKQLQKQGKKVMMIGDGLNDAGALKQADVGIAITENSNNFTPASDGILEAGNLPLLPKFIRLCRINKRIIMASFVVSILYNIIGICIAVQGNLLPMIAAVLMPASSLTILLVTFGASSFAAKMLGLKY